jgi:hypothetical protein
MPQLEKLARLAGARFVLRELAHEKTVARGGRLTLQMRWANVGAGKLYRPYALRLFLLNPAGEAVVAADAAADPRDWLPGEHRLAEAVPVPEALAAGEYTVALMLTDRTGQRPPFHLALDAPEKDGHYALSKVRVE